MRGQEEAPNLDLGKGERGGGHSLRKDASDATGRARISETECSRQRKQYMQRLCERQKAFSLQELEAV